MFDNDASTYRSPVARSGLAPQYGDRDAPRVLECCERMTNHLTAAIVSRDMEFINHIVANTVNGTTYAGIR